MGNPIEILYSWQAFLVALSVAGLTQLIKTVYDVWQGQRVVKRISTAPPTPSPVRDEQEKASYREPPKKMKPMAVGKEVRQSNPWLNRIVMPMIPIILGALFGAFVPLRPEVLVEYAETHVQGWFWQSVVFGTWGAACGQFADYTFSKAKAIMHAFVNNKSATALAQLGAEATEDNESSE